jgi:ADP-ribose pyrophosphatase YjhB (NUDIX family)
VTARDGLSHPRMLNDGAGCLCGRPKILCPVSVSCLVHRVPGHVALKGVNMTKGAAFGGIVFDNKGRVLLRMRKDHFGDYMWAFPKGRPDSGESPEETALRGVFVECGVKGEIIGKLPLVYDGDTTQNVFYLMRPLEGGFSFDSDTKEVRWATSEEARELLSETTGITGKKKELRVLEDARLAFYALPVKDTLEVPTEHVRILATEVHALLCELHQGCRPKVCAKKSTPYVRYAPFPDLFHLRLTQSTCGLQISKKLDLKEALSILADFKVTKKWDVLAINSEEAVTVLSKALKTHTTRIRAIFLMAV